MKVSLRSLQLLGISGAIGSAYIAAYLLPHQEDLLIYLNGSHSLRESRNPYTATNNQYIYGPLLAILLSPLTNLDFNQAKIIWGILNLASVIPITFLLLKLKNKTPELRIFLVILILILASFSFRNNLGQGQAVAWLLSLSLLSLYLSFSAGEISKILAALAILPVIEIKPYLAIGLVAFFALNNKKRIVTYLAVIIFSLNMLYSFFYEITYLDWLRALEIRSKSVTSGSDQSSIAAILSVNFQLESSSIHLLVAVYYLAIIFIVYRYRKNIKWNLLPFCLVFPSVATPFLHSHDVLFALAGLVLVMGTSDCFPKNRGLLLGILFVIHIGWTSNEVIVGIALCVMVAISLRSAFAAIPWVWIMASGSASIAWTLILHFGFDLSSYSRIHIYNLSSLLFAFLVFLFVASTPPDNMSVLSPSRDNLDWDS
jgi:hypothetical protein